MLELADTDRKVRATRAYLAGFGTSGSLLAGAAVMFVLASAIVSFHGWPQVGSQNPIINVSAPQVTVAPSSRAARILSGLSPGAAAGGGLTTTGSTGTPAAATVPAGGRGTTSHPVAGTSTGPTTGVHLACQGTSCAGPAPKPHQTLTGVVSQTVTKAGSSLGSAVTGASNAAANAVAPVSPAVANTIRRAGHSTAHVVTGVANVASSTVTTAGSLVSGLTHH